MKMDPLARHLCVKYSCELASVACASRYERVVKRSKTSLYSQITDPNCANCKVGKQMLKAIGEKAINDYRRELWTIRNKGQSKKRKES